MSGAQPRGPSGGAPLPPDWLSATDLPIELVPAGDPLFRVHRVELEPRFFGPGPGEPATYRFDSPSSSFGVLYVGRSLDVALVETLARNPARKMIAYADVIARASSVLRSPRDLRLVPLHGSGLQKVGCDNSISTGPYDPCGVWADFLWRHRSQPDGIAYQSRHDSSQICIALFERPDLNLDAEPRRPLGDQLETIAEVLTRYGKSISL